MKDGSNHARREFLRLASLTAAGAGLGLAAKASSHPAPRSEERVFKPVHVTAGRVIRTVVGLRPFRASGFVLKTEKIHDKLVIHNYGHGGAGVTLSWGTAKLAVDMALPTGAKSYAVLGSGVIGLSTARLLQKKGFDVTIYSRELPPETTSNIAGALWFPTSVFDKSKVNNAFMDQFNAACKISFRIFQDHVGEHYGVKWLEQYFLGRAEEYPGGKELYPNIKEHQNPYKYFGYDYAQQLSAMLIEPPVYMNALMRDFLLFGGKLVIREFNTRDDLAALTEPVIMNCTGLGSHKLFNDTELIPVRGQLAILLPQPEIDYAYVVPVKDDLLYMFPRKDGIVLGGTSEPGNWSVEPTQQEIDRIIKGHAKISRHTGL
jgi:glycine/D-amino acid oxidase-like deaminating enzyme